MNNFDSHSCNKDILHEKVHDVYFKVILQADERFISITNGPLEIIESMKLMKISLDTKVKAMNLDDYIFKKNIFGG